MDLHLLDAAPTAEEREARRFDEDVTHHHDLVVAQSRAGHLVASLGEVLVHLGTTIVIGYGGWLALRGELTAGELTRFWGYVIIMYGPVRRFAELNVTYQSSLAALRRVLGVFDDAGINLTRIESRPAPGKRWQYVFFTDIEGHRSDANVAEALRALEGLGGAVRVLGSYPRTV